MRVQRRNTLQRLRLVALATLCLVPVAFAYVDSQWIPPWQRKELSACAGNYVLPSGIFLHVVQQGVELRAGERGWNLQRNSRYLFSGESTSIRIRFLPDDNGKINSLKLSGVCPATSARRANNTDSDCARLVDVGGHSLKMNVIGLQHSGPTVILETGPLGGLEGISQFQASVATFARVVAYDHPGTGGSERGPSPQTAYAVAKQLRTALSEMSIEPPFILAGISMGGPYTRVFADQFPDDIGGLVWIDPTPDWDHLYAWCAKNAQGLGPKIKRSMQWLDLAIESGLRESPEAGRRDEWESMGKTWDEVRNATLPDIPIIQITGAKDHPTREAAAAKVKYFAQWLKVTAPNARHVLAKKSRHGVFATEPDLVLEAIRSLVVGSL